MIADYLQKIQGFLPSQEDLSEYGANPSIGPMLSSFERLTTWFGLLYHLRSQEQTSVLIAAAHSKIIEIWILVPLGLLHSSYSALRTVVDIAVSYSFYHSHPIEWSAVCQGRSGWESRANIVNWHVRYTPTCREVNSAFSLVDALDNDYHKLSSYVHGTPLSGLPTLKSIERSVIPDEELEKLVQMAGTVDKNMNLLFLSVFNQALAAASNQDLRTITKGVNRQKLASAGIVLPRV